MSETERDELASVVVEAYGEDPRSECPCEQDFDVADTILAAGYRRPRTVTTVEELDALPKGAVVMGADGYVARRFPGGWRVLVVEPASSPWLTDTLEDVDLPATVLHEPEATK